MDKFLRYTLRVERELFKKFQYMARYNVRSVNKEMERAMRRAVKDFEESHEPIVDDERQ